MLEHSVLFVLIIVSVLEYTYNTQGRVVILLFFVSLCNAALYI